MASSRPHTRIGAGCRHDRPGGGRTACDLRWCMSTPLCWAGIVSTLVWLVAPKASAYRTLQDQEGTTDPIVWTTAPSVYLEASSEVPTAMQTLFATELRAAIDTWNAVSCVGRVLSSSTDAAAPVHVRLTSDWAAHGLDQDAAATTDVALADQPDGSVSITGATTYVNLSFTWGPHPQDGDQIRDIRAALTHELGHVLGLLHPCEPSVPTLQCQGSDRASTMYPVYQGSSQCTLGSDDEAALCSLYGGPASRTASDGGISTCSADADCGVGERCSAGSCVADFRYGSPCGAGSDCPTGVCVALTASAGVCSLVCSSDAECPAQTFCDHVSGGRATDKVCAPQSFEQGSCAIAHGRASDPPGLPLLLAVVAARWLGAGRRAQRARQWSAARALKRGPT